MKQTVNPGDRVYCPYCGDVFELDESRVTKGLKSSGGSPLIRVPCCSCGRMFEITLSAAKEEHSLIEAVDRLIKIYENHPEGLYPDAPDRSKVREIGQTLYDSGGMDSMLAVHREFASRSYRHARNLEMVWNGIGEWLG